MNGMVRLITPLLFHMLVSEVVMAGLGGTLGRAACTTVTAVAVIPVALWMYCKDGRRAETGPQYSRGKLLVLGVLCFLFGGALNLLLSFLMQLTGISAMFSNATQEELLLSSLAVQAAGMGLLIPIAEELIFRGLIYRRMKEFLPVRAAVVLSALLFSVYHGNPIQMIFAFPMALVLTILYERGGQFLFPVLFHMGANLTAVILNIL